MKTTNIRTVFMFPDNSMLEFDRSNGLLNVELGNNSVSDNTQPNYGIIADAGRIELIDKDKTFRNKFTTSYEQKLEVYVSIYINNILYGPFIINSEIDYNIFSQNVTINMDSQIIKFQKIYCDIPLQISTLYNYTLFDVFQMLRQKSGSYRIIIDADTLNELKTKHCGNPFYLIKDTLWNQWDKLMNAMQGRMFQDFFGNINIIKDI